MPELLVGLFVVWILVILYELVQFRRISRIERDRYYVKKKRGRKK